jgi:hypothetical protein
LRAIFCLPCEEALEIVLVVPLPLLLPVMLR